MFTGIILRTGHLINIKRKGIIWEFEVEVNPVSSGVVLKPADLSEKRNCLYSSPSQEVRIPNGVKDFTEDISIGSSINIDGVCLTVKDKKKDKFKVACIKETIDKTTIKYYKPNQIVNLEKALKLGGRINGHLLYGHIDGIGKISSIKKRTGDYIFEIKVDKNLLKYIIFKGAIAVDGISLTVTDVNYESFKFSTIPLTLELTNLKYKKISDYVNIELDPLVKYVEKLFKNSTAF